MNDTFYITKKGLAKIDSLEIVSEFRDCNGWQIELLEHHSAQRFIITGNDESNVDELLRYAKLNQDELRKRGRPKFQLHYHPPFAEPEPQGLPEPLEPPEPPPQGLLEPGEVNQQVQEVNQLINQMQAVNQQIQEVNHQQLPVPPEIQIMPIQVQEAPIINVNFDF